MEMDGTSFALVWTAAWVVVGLMTALLARSKGRNFIGWWLYGALTFPIALLHALLMAPQKHTARTRSASSEAQRRCPHCGEAIKRDLDVCPQCWRVVPVDGVISEGEDEA